MFQELLKSVYVLVFYFFIEKYIDILVNHLYG